MLSKIDPPALAVGLNNDGADHQKPDDVAEKWPGMSSIWHQLRPFKNPLLLSVFAIFVVITVGMYALFYAAGLDDRKAQERMVQSIAVLMSGHVEQAISRGDDILRALAENYLDDPKGIDRYVERKFSAIDRVLYPQIGIIGADGIVVVTSQYTNALKRRVDLSDREHFSIHAKVDTPLDDKIFISKVVIGRVQKTPVIQISRAIRDSAGKFLGVGVVSVNPEEFLRPYYALRTLNPDQRAIVTIVGSDGFIRMSVNAGLVDDAITLINTEVFKGVVSRGSGFIYLEKSKHSDDILALNAGKEGALAYSKVAGLPLHVITGKDINTVIPDDLAKLGIPFAIILFVCMGVMMAIAGWSEWLRLQLATSVLLMKSSNEKLKLASTAEKHLLVSISHELRTPLHGILGHAQLISRAAPTEEVRESSDAILKSAKDLREIVTLLLDKARLDAGKDLVSLAPVSIARLVQDIATIHQVVASEKKLKFEIDVGGVRSLVIESDELLLKRCLNNLISNALKFTDVGWVKVSAFLDDNGQLVIIVSDTGCGILAEDVGQIFNVYTRLNRDFVNAAEGSGLGLALTKAMIKALMGELTVTSIPGAGSQFRISLPCRYLSKNGSGLKGRVSVSSITE